MLTLDDNNSIFQVRSYQPGLLKVNDQLFTRSIIVTRDKLMDDWKPQLISELKPEDLSIIISLSPAILLIGTGATLEFPPIETYGELINHGIGVEVMDTGAACRTFNALTSEERNVVAALIIR